MARFDGIDSGWIEGSVVRVDDEFIYRQLGVQDYQYLSRRWRCVIIDRLPAERRTDLMFHVPTITMMGRRGERKVEY